MKTTLLFLALSFILCTTATAAPEPVLDIYGKNLRTGTEYYIMPLFRGRVGNLYLRNTGNGTCSIDFVQEKPELSSGYPVTFSPVDIKKGVIRVSTDNNIKFSYATICDPQSTVWKLSSFDESTRQWFVTGGGAEGNPGPRSTSNWFKIEKYEDQYKFVFCPTVCKFCKVLCRNVGIFTDDAGINRLALSDEPLKVTFRTT